MSYKFGARSLLNLQSSHPSLQRLFIEVIKVIDCAVIEGHRGADKQDELFHAGRSKLKFPNSKHNAKPSLAVDVIPWPVDWNDTKTFYYFGGIVLGIASQMNIKIRWGGDWNRNHNFKDQTFNDLPHYELILVEGIKNDTSLI